MLLLAKFLIYLISLPSLENRIFAVSKCCLTKISKFSYSINFYHFKKDGICEESETFLSCSKDCPDELPGCEVFNDQGCRLNSQIDANSGVDKRRWQTPKPGQPGYLPGFQDQYALVGYADIRYKSIDRTSADLCIVAIHKYNATLTYYFSGEPQLSNCKTFTNAQNKSVGLRVIGADGTRLDISSVNFVWNAQPLTPRPGDYRSGQKGI
jgi:hypothetical protein